MKILLIALFLFSFSAKASITADVVSPNITEGEAIELHLSSDTLKNKEPDLSVLSKDFEILGAVPLYSGGSIVIEFNGKRINSVDNSFSLVIGLYPKKTGTLTIPSITWDNEKTQPVEVTVLPAQSSYESSNGVVIKLTGKILNEHVYENAALIYQAEVMSNVRLTNFEFLPPEMDNAEIKPEGREILGQKKEGDVVYQTWKQYFSIFPQKAGSKEKIKGAGLRGAFLKERAVSNQFVYSARSSNEFVSLRADNQEIDVLPRPVSWDGKWWLPAQKVKLKEIYKSDLNNAKIGESITRTIEVKAYGVRSEQLPDIVIPSTDDFKVYAETPQKETVFHPVFGIEGVSKQSFVFVPLKSGNLTLPEIKINWFNTDTEQDEESVLPSKTILVQKNDAIKEEVKVAEPKVKAEVQTEQPVITVQENKYAKENNFLYFIAGLSIGFILLLVVVIIFLRPKKKKLPDLYPKK